MSSFPFILNTIVHTRHLTNELSYVDYINFISFCQETISKVGIYIHQKIYSELYSSNFFTKATNAPFESFTIKTSESSFVV